MSQIRIEALPEGTTDPHHFYPHEEKRTKLKEELKDEVLNCLKSKYCKAHELSWIRFLVVFPSEAGEESKYDLTGIIISFV